MEGGEKEEKGLESERMDVLSGREKIDRNQKVFSFYPSSRSRLET